MHFYDFLHSCSTFAPLSAAPSVILSCTSKETVKSGLGKFRAVPSAFRTRNRIADIANLDYKVKNKKGNFLGTYDHYIIVSQKFKDFCEENHYEGLEFIQLPKSPTSKIGRASCRERV